MSEVDQFRSCLSAVHIYDFHIFIFKYFFLFYSTVEGALTDRWYSVIGRCTNFISTTVVAALELSLAFHIVVTFLRSSRT